MTPWLAVVVGVSELEVFMAEGLLPPTSEAVPGVPGSTLIVSRPI